MHPRLAMELARHSDLKLTMKNYTDAGQLPLQEVMDSLPGYGIDSRIDSRNLVAESPAVSTTDAVAEIVKQENLIANIGESHGLSLTVAASPPNGEWRREGDSNSPLHCASSLENHRFSNKSAFSSFYQETGDEASGNKKTGILLGSVRKRAALFFSF